MKKIVLFPHGGSGNHGCEAIVRTTADLLRPQKVMLFSNAPWEDEKYIGRELVELKQPMKEASRLSAGYMKALFDTYVKKDKDAYDALYFSPVIDACDRNSVLLSIGGDNYCYGDNGHIFLVNRRVRRQGARTVLWGCSVEPGAISPAMETDLRGYDLIIARESLTFEAVSTINRNTVLLPDPAFLLPKTPGKYPDGLGSRPYVGLNVSPMVQSREVVPGITERAFQKLIEGILAETTFDVALIPHVVWAHNDDRKPLMLLYETFKNSGRVFLVEDQNCTQLKDIISCCRLFLGARTHATIAAYSSCVPTLAIGYSVKARGIAKDLLGTEKDNVFSIYELASEMDLWNAFEKFLKREDEIRKNLQTRIPGYLDEARELRSVLDRLK